MKYKTIIIPVVALFVLGSFYGYRYIKNRANHQQNTEDTYRRMTEMAKISAISGLPQMARALNRYYTDYKTYPPNLNELYPKYIQNHSFIRDISWQYRPRVNDFLLVKSVSTENRILVATIDKDLRPKTPRAMIAETPPQTPTALAEKIVKNVPRKVPVQLPPPKNDTTRSKNNASVILSSKNKESDKEISEYKEEQKNQPPNSESDSEPDTEEVTYEKLMTLSQSYFVWKDKKGRLGFSNVQYPDKREIALIFINGRWQEFQD